MILQLGLQTQELLTDSETSRGQGIQYHHNSAADQAARQLMKETEVHCHVISPEVLPCHAVNGTGKPPRNL